MNCPYVNLNRFWIPAFARMTGGSEGRMGRGNNRGGITTDVYSVFSHSIFLNPRPPYGNGLKDSTSRVSVDVSDPLPAITHTSRFTFWSSLRSMETMSPFRSANLSSK